MGFTGKAFPGEKIEKREIAEHFHLQYVTFSRAVKKAEGRKVLQ